MPVAGGRALPCKDGAACSSTGAEESLEPSFHTSLVNVQITESYLIIALQACVVAEAGREMDLRNTKVRPEGERYKCPVRLRA